MSLDSVMKSTNLYDIDLAVESINFWDHMLFTYKAFSIKCIDHWLLIFIESLKNRDVFLFNNNINPLTEWNEELCCCSSISSNN